MSSLSVPSSARQDSLDCDSPPGGRQTGAFRRYTALLAGVADAPANASTREIARRAGLSPATAYRLLNELLDTGIVFLDPATGRYALSAGFVSLVDRIAQRDALRNAALPWMQELRDLSGETATLVIAFGRERVCILQIKSHQKAHYGAAVGAVDRLQAGVPGKVLLAFLAPAAREDYLSWVRVSEGSAAEEALRAVIRRVRETGYVVGRAERAPECTVVSVPVFGPAGAIAALSVVGPASRWREVDALALLPRMSDAATSIAQAVFSV